jgi:hypothetical protein
VEVHGNRHELRELKGLKVGWPIGRGAQRQNSVARCG